MGAYRSAENPDRAKALAGVALVHVALGTLILSGLTVSTMTTKTDALKVFDISDDVPPPPLEPPPPVADSPAAKDAPAPANARSTPTEIVAPRQVSPPVPLPISAALAPGRGSDPSAGASNRGSGTGAGGAGSGSGGGGNGPGGAGQGFTPARLVQNIRRSDYRAIVAGGMPEGSVGLHIVIGTDGRLRACSIARSSGDRVIDARLCRIAMDELRFRPARDAQGGAIAYESDYMAVWGRR